MIGRIKAWIKEREEGITMIIFIIVMIPTFWILYGLLTYFNIGAPNS